MKRLLLAVLLMTSAMMLGGVATAGAATVKVTAADVGGADWFGSDTRTGGARVFETGEELPPVGGGSVELTTTTAGAKVQLFTDLYNGTRLDTIDGIGYSTYRDPASIPTPGVAMAALNMRVALDGGAAPTAYMVFEPYQQEAGENDVVTGSWQDWDAYRSKAARWWINTGSTCTQATPCTITDILTQHPNLTIREGASCGPGGVTTPCAGSLGLNQGSGNQDTKSNADALYVSVNGDQTTFDFEESAGPVGPPGGPGAPGNDGDDGTNGTNGTNGTSGTNGQNGAPGAPGAQGPAGNIGPSGEEDTTSAVVIRSKRLKASKRRKVRVAISCPRANGLCEGRIRLVRRGRILVSQAFELRGGRNAKVTLTLSEKLFESLGRGKRVQINVFNRDLAGTASTSGKTVQLTR